MTVPKELDFDADDGDHSSSVTFKLGGREWHCKAAGDLPLNFMGLQQPDGTLYTQIGPFFERVLIPEDADAFLELLDAPRSPITFSNAMPLMQKVTEKLVKRPTRRPASSPGGSSSTKGKSGAGSSSRATPRKR